MCIEILIKINYWKWFSSNCEGIFFFFKEVW